jgi:hypothetical protein
MSAPVLITVNSPAFPNGQATLRQLFDAEFGAGVGSFLIRATTGWSPLALPHFKVVPLVGVASTSGGGLGNFVPNEGLPVVITYTAILVQVKSTGAATVDIGVGATTTTSADNLIDGADVGTGAGVAFDNITDISTNGKSRQYMSGTQAVTVTGLADTTGFVGVLYVAFIKI